MSCSGTRASASARARRSLLLCRNSSTSIWTSAMRSRGRSRRSCSSMSAASLRACTRSIRTERAACRSPCRWESSAASRAPSPTSVLWSQAAITPARVPGMRCWAWYLAGLNFQVEHHLFPRVCHLHYPALSRIVEETCRALPVRTVTATRRELAVVASHGIRTPRKVPTGPGASRELNDAGALNGAERQTPFPSGVPARARSGDGHRSTHTLPAETRVGLHLDLARLRLRLLGKEDAQHAIVALRRDVPHLHCRGQRKSPGEAAVGPLDAVIPLLLVGVLELALAAHGERVALEPDVDIVGIDLRQLDLQRDALAVLEDVDEGRPAAAGAVGFFVGLLEVLVEQLVPHLLHRFTKRIIPDDRHLNPPR